MSNLYHRIVQNTTFAFAAMENHIHKFLNKIRPAFGLWRGAYSGTLSAKVRKDVESGLSGLIQIQPQDGTADAAENTLQSQSAGSLEADHEEPVDLLPESTSPDDVHVEQEELPQPQFTEGPSRFVLAKDGSRDCVALLVNETFLAKLRDLFQEEREFEILDEPLSHADLDLRNIERSMQESQKALETAESDEEAEEYHNTLEQQTDDLHKLRRWRDEIREERRKVKSDLELSRNHTQWVLETAMRKADLLGPEKPPPAILRRESETDDIEEEIAVKETQIPPKSPASSIANDNNEAEVNQEELQRRETYDEFIESLRYLDTVQEKFDHQGFLYRENLAEYQEMVKAGTISISRSEFDRRKVLYGQRLTRALIDAEEAFEEARERAQALGAISSDYGQECYYGAEYEESWPENKVAEYIASQDWSSVEAWVDDVLDPTGHADVDSVEIDEWDAEEVDVNDSISVIDYEDYRRDIDRNRRICARLEDPCPEVRWLGQPDARVLERRSSCWM